MKKAIQLFVLMTISIHSYGQMIMSAQGVNPENVCKPNTVYFLMTDKAKPIQAIDSIEVKLNDAVKFVSKNPTFEAKPSIQLAVNCNGEIGGGFHVVISSGNKELDDEILAFFKGITLFTAGKIKKKTVDSWYMWRMEIKNGKIDVLN